MKTIFLILLAAVFQFSCTSQEIDERRKTLLPALKNINSIDPKNEDFSDLQFLKKIIERDSVRVILLGEQTHGDGSTFLAKTRLIKFLNKEAGFDVLAFESGLFDCTFAWEKIKVNGLYTEEIRKAVFPLWVSTNECEDLLNYLQGTLQTKNPIELSGFDTQLTGTNGRQLLIDELIRYKLDFLTQSEMNIIVKIVSLDEDAASGKDKTYNNIIIDKLINGLDSLSRSKPEFEYWKLVTEGIKQNYNGYLAMKFEKANYNDADIMNARDKQMGKNLTWLLLNKYKGRKIIVWAANFHCFRNSEELTSVTESLKFINEINKKTVTIGDILYDSLKNRIYTIGFTQFTGKRRNIQKNNTEDVPGNNELSFENIISSVGNEYSFIDMRDNSNPEWLKGKFIASLRSGKELKGKWQNVTDGIFYIKEMKPSSYGDEK